MSTPVLARGVPARATAAPAMRLHLKRTRYFVASDVMQDGVARAKARAFVKAARSAGVSTLLHISTNDLRPKHGKLVSTSRYRHDVARIVAYFRRLGVRDFGAWNEVNHKTQQTWNHVGINRSRSRATASIIRTVHRYNRHARFWFTETGALAGFRSSFPYSESRQAARVRNLFTYANRYRKQGVQRVYYYNWFGTVAGGCGHACPFDAGLVDPDGTPRPVYGVVRSKLRSYSR